MIPCGKPKENANDRSGGAFTLLVLIGTFLTFGIVCARAEEYSLEDLYKAALKQAERIKIAEEDVNVARYQKDQAFSYLFPSITTSADVRSYTDDQQISTGPFQTIVQPKASASWALRLNQSFSTSGRELMSVGILKETVKKSEYDLYAVREDYVQNVAASYYDVLRGQRAIDIAEANVARLTKHRNEASTRLRVGEVTKTALLRAEAELSGAQSDLVKARNLYDSSRAILARLVSIEEGFVLKKTGVPEPATSDSPAFIKIGGCASSDLHCLKEKALATRAELKSAEILKRVADEQVRYAKGANWPTVSIEAAYVRNDNNPAQSTAVNKSVYGGVKLSVPIFEGGFRQAQIHEAQTRDRQALLNVADQRKTISLSVENAFLDAKTQAGVLKSLEDQVAYAHDNYGAVSKQFAMGLANSTDVMDANTALLTAERQLTDAHFNYQLSILRLQRTTGTLLQTITEQHQNPGTGQTEGSHRIIQAKDLWPSPLVVGERGQKE